MKRLFALITVIVMCCVLFAACDQLPEEFQAVLSDLGLGDEKTDTTDSDVPAHEHDFVVKSTKDATCVSAGVIYYECECGEKNEEAISATGEHDFALSKDVKPNCTDKGTKTYKCTVCSKVKRESYGEPEGHDYSSTVLTEPTCVKQGMNKLTCSKCNNMEAEYVPATGIHNYDETIGASRILRCTEPLCGSTKIREYFGEYRKVIVYTFSEDDIAKYDEIMAELNAIISDAEAYDASKHAYSTDSELYSQYLEMEAKYLELDNMLAYVTGQYQIAQLEYYIDLDNSEKQNNLTYMSEVRTEMVAGFYSLSRPIYDSMFREFAYYGMTEKEIEEFIGDSDYMNDETYQALNASNTEIEIKFNSLSNPAANPQVPEMYEQFVANNNRIAEIIDPNYDSYVEYAYQEIYGRDYAYTDVASIVEYTKEYIVPVLKYVYNAWYGLWPSGYVSDGERNTFYAQITESFFDNYESNLHLNDYIDLLAFSSNSDKQISFSDEMDKMFEKGTYFRGDYEGAYVTYLYGVNTPIAYFGPGYDNPFTVAHEFGHYMNEVYNENGINQSYDLLEMHSQGNEILFLHYLSDKLAGDYTFDLVESYNMLNMLATVVTSLSVDTFEQAVYANTYTGTYADIIMADGKIDSSEYDTLYKGILIDFDVYTDDGNDENDILTAEYWRYVTIGSPCYYVSYAISALSVLQLYPMAGEDYDAAIDSYLKLFTYIDEVEASGEYMTTEEILEYAGLYSFTDEELYASIYNYFLGDE